MFWCFELCMFDFPSYSVHIQLTCHFPLIVHEYNISWTSHQHITNIPSTYHEHSINMSLQSHRYPIINISVISHESRHQPRTHRTLGLRWQRGRLVLYGPPGHGHFPSLCPRHPEPLRRRGAGRIARGRRPKTGQALWKDGGIDLQTGWFHGYGGHFQPWMGIWIVCWRWKIP